jgi:hypothetical protein
MAALSILFAGIAVGAALTLCAALLREKPRTPAHWVGGLFLISIAGYGIIVPQGLPPVQPFAAIAQVLAWAGTAYFWLFAYTVFTDARVRPILFAPVAFMTIFGLIGAATPRPASETLWLAHNVLEVFLTAHILWTIWKSAGGDLVEARRSVRAPFFAAVCPYAIAQSGIEIFEILSKDRSWGVFALTLTLAALSLVGSALFLQLRPGLLPASASAAKADAPADPSRIPAADRALAAKLDAAMDAGPGAARASPSALSPPTSAPPNTVCAASSTTPSAIATSPTSSTAAASKPPKPRSPIRPAPANRSRRSPST